ncbi:hypothetical protein CgunFtcFv8_018599 [Champsocephalus gunnari]|uniref:Uncharacterized protein n=1 Tax=Champsocephalus gunnari TaxID=52237 RepID=A0AAN8BT58_CHAGU|nr:hypothetical protein CgunFtcFv8_018599 [Champsocephalus gunnari]
MNLGGGDRDNHPAALTSHVRGMQRPWPTSPHERPFMGPRSGERTCIKQGSHPWGECVDGKHGAENSLTQKASYGSRGRAERRGLLDTCDGGIPEWHEEGPLA